MKYEMKSELLKFGDKEKQFLLGFAREALKNNLDFNPKSFFQLKTRYEPLPETLQNPRPCFVTITSGDDKLRGCIGCVETSKSLFENVHDYTILAATQDSRFSPVKLFEVPSIKIEISVLGTLVQLKQIEALRLGEQGLFVKHRGFSGLLLAQVADKFHWNREEFLRQTCYKAGLDPAGIAEYEVSYFDEIAFSD